MRKPIAFAVLIAFFPACVVAAPEADKDAEKRKAAAEAAEKRLATETALDATLPSFTCERASFEDVLAEITKAAGVAAKPDWTALEPAGVKRTTPVSARIRNVKFRKALAIVLADAAETAKPAGVKVAVRLEHYAEDEGNVVVTTRAQFIKAHTVDRKYDISDLIRASLGANPAADMEKKLVSEFVTLIMETVDPDSWGAVPAKIEYDGKGTLNVRQLKDNQRQVANLLNQLRETANLKLPENVGGDGL